MEKLTEVLAMGGYGIYVWPSFTLAAVVMAGLLIGSLRAAKRAGRMLALIQDSSAQ